MDEYLRFVDVRKSFPGVRALDRISFGVRAGAVHGLIGENGAGKSTLLKILSGAYRPDAGEIVIDGQSCAFNTTRDAMRAGVAIIYQELNLVPEMTVGENIFLGMLPSRAGLLDRRSLRQRAADQLARVGLDVSPSTLIHRLSLAQRQMVEIAKALSKSARIIAFDEPTSSLSAREVRRLFDTIRELKSKGHAIIYVSHRMEELFELCDSMTVLRDGRVVKCYPQVAGVTREMLVVDMIERSIEDVYAYRPRRIGEVLLDVRGLAGRGSRAPAWLQLRRGEVLGCFGLVGAGRSDLLRLIFGAERRRAGSVALRGSPVRTGRIRDTIASGIMLCPEDRKLHGIIPLGSVLDNINLSARRSFSPGGFLIRTGRELDNASRFVSQLGIKTPSLRQRASHLSGGNQQKVILARWLSENVQVLMMDEPTRGIDVGGKHEIYNLIQELAEGGVGMLIVSSDLPEVLGISDRIIVMREGAVVGSLSREQATPEKLLSMALPASASTTSTSWPPPMTTSMNRVAAAAKSPSARSRLAFALWEDAGMLLIYVTLFAVVSLTVPYFLSFQNMVGLSLAVSMVGMLACSMLFCLAAGDFDLSIGSVLAFAGVFNAVMMEKMPGQIVLPVLLSLAASALIGVFNGTVIARLGINALITTLATMQMVRGLGFILSNGVAVGVANEDFYVLGNGTLLGVPGPIWATLACFAIFGFLLNRTVYGRNTLAIGGNPDAARLSGIDVGRTKIIIFGLQGLLAGVAGVILSSRITSGQPNAAQGFELDVISACVLGGVSLSGGVGTMVGTIVGVMIMGTVQNVLNLLNVPTFYQYLVRGTVLLLAVLFDRLKQRRHVG